MDQDFRWVRHTTNPSVGVSYDQTRFSTICPVALGCFMFQYDARPFHSQDERWVEGRSGTFIAERGI